MKGTYNPETHEVEIPDNLTEHKEERPEWADNLLSEMRAIFQPETKPTPPETTPETPIPTPNPAPEQTQTETPKPKKSAFQRIMDIL